ncbi:ATP-grasp domain-containing protein [Kitasatospora sp. GP82]|uniref:ATP-grasp domain-containing protein n=1 Tax=Kitasatospora sp. GP82 TaxID=3035089 RepID=UPI002475B2CE|nr:ATP-grasp domain-containing protein [Kitasatospora sp. GP82]MDH6128728.1 hypothetical protein [Kitasatospora sp. GP82]
MITSFDDACRQLRALPGLGFAARPYLLLPLLRAGCLSVLLSSESADEGWDSRFGVELHSLEADTLLRDDRRAREDLGELLRRLPERVGTRWQGRELALAGYFALQQDWRAALARLGVSLLAVPAEPDSPVLTDKTAMRTWFRALGLSTPADALVGALDHRELRRRFGGTFVVQQPTGSGGRGTYLVTDEDALRRIPPGGPWLVSEYAGDISLNYHGLVGADGTPSVLRPSLQLTDVPGTGAAFGRYSGCDYRAPAALPPRALARCEQAMERIGWGLAELGHRGVFGADFVVRGESTVVLELNCRVQGSTWLLGELELAERGLPTLLRHFLERRGHPTAAKPAFDPVDAVQLAIRHTGPPARLLSAPRGGVYALDGGRLHRRADGYGLLECGPDECVLLHIPRPGTRLLPGSPTARLLSRRALTAPDGKVLTPHGRRLVEALPALYTLAPARPAPRRGGAVSSGVSAAGKN